MTRGGSAMLESRTEVLGYNNRGELASVSTNVDHVVFQCEYDDIGNRVASFDRGYDCEYAVNGLNQYTNYIALGIPPRSFIPQFDPDGNQTLINTSTGVWSVSYNAENRPKRV